MSRTLCISGTLPLVREVERFNVLRSAALYRRSENLTREHAGTQNPSKRLEPLTPRHSHTPDDLSPKHHRCEEFQNELSKAKTRSWSGRSSNALRVLSSSGIHLTFTMAEGYSVLTKCLHTRKLNTIRGQTTTGVLKDGPFRITSWHARLNQKAVRVSLMDAIPAFSLGTDNNKYILHHF